LYPRKEFLTADHSGVVERVVVDPAALDCAGVGGVDGVECYEDVAEGGGGDVLQDVHVVSEADGGWCGGVGGGGGWGWGLGDEVPSGPGAGLVGHELEVVSLWFMV